MVIKSLALLQLKPLGYIVYKNVKKELEKENLINDSKKKQFKRRFSSDGYWSDREFLENGLENTKQNRPSIGNEEDSLDTKTEASDYLYCEEDKYSWSNIAKNTIEMMCPICLQFICRATHTK